MTFVFKIFCRLCPLAPGIRIFSILGNTWGWGGGVSTDVPCTVLEQGGHHVTPCANGWAVTLVRHRHDYWRGSDGKLRSASWKVSFFFNFKKPITKVEFWYFQVESLAGFHYVFVLSTRFGSAFDLLLWPGTIHKTKYCQIRRSKTLLTLCKLHPIPHLVGMPRKRSRQTNFRTYWIAGQRLSQYKC